MFLLSRRRPAGLLDRRRGPCAARGRGTMEHRRRTVPRWQRIAAVAGVGVLVLAGVTTWLTWAHAGSPGAAVPPGAARAFTFVNAVQQTIWLAAYQQTPQPALATTGWVLPAGQSLTV